MEKETKNLLNHLPISLILPDFVNIGINLFLFIFIAPKISAIEPWGVYQPVGILHTILPSDWNTVPRDCMILSVLSMGEQIIGRHFLSDQ